MISIDTNHYEKLKERLNKINIKKNKKRVTDTRLHLTQYISHVLPLSSQRFVLSPFNRSSLLSQIGCDSFKGLFNIRNPTPFSVLKGSFDKFGFLNLWKGTTSHLLSGVVFPGFYILSKWVSNLTYIPYTDKRRSEYVRRYAEAFSICTFSHVFSYPLDTCYVRLASDYRNSFKLKTYIKDTLRKRGIKNLYTGFSFCLLSTATHLMLTLPLNQNIQYRVINSINEEISKNPILKTNIKAIKPKELKPVELFPFNLIFATLSSFISKTVTYPIDTLNNLMLYISTFSKSTVRFISLWRPFNKPNDKYQKGINEKLLYPGSVDKQSNVTKLWDGIKNTLFSDAKNPDEETEKYFKFSVKKLMESPGRFTFQNFSKYLEELCTELKLIGKRTIPEEQVTGSLIQLRNHYRMMSLLTEHELESDSHTVFTYETKRLISESLGLTVKDVDDMLKHHDICKMDRTWYFRRLVLGRHLPTSYKERDHLSYQRPSLRLSHQQYPQVDSLEALEIKKMREEVKYSKTRPRTWPWYRHRTSGNDYWRTRPYTKLRK